MLKALLDRSMARAPLAPVALAVLLLALSCANFDSGMEAYEAGKYEAAIDAWQQLAEKGDARAQNNVGMMFHRGEGVPPDPEAAAEWFHKAAAQGLAEAEYNLAVLLLTGRGLDEDAPQAAEWFEKAANQGHVAASFNLGAMYFSGKGREKDAAEGQRRYLEAADRGLAIAQFHLARSLPPEEALAWYRRAAEHGMAEAQTALGFAVDCGAGGAEDPAQATDWYAEAARQDFAPAEWALGVRYALGRGVVADESAAENWFERAGKHGFTAPFSMKLVCHLKDEAESVADFDEDKTYDIALRRMMGETSGVPPSCLVTRPETKLASVEEWSDRLCRLRIILHLGASLYESEVWSACHNLPVLQDPRAEPIVELELARTE